MTEPLHRDRTDATDRDADGFVIDRLRFSPLEQDDLRSRTRRNNATTAMQLAIALLAFVLAMVLIFTDWPNAKPAADTNPGTGNGVTNHVTFNNMPPTNPNGQPNQMSPRAFVPSDTPYYNVQPANTLRVTEIKKDCDGNSGQLWVYLDGFTPYDTYTASTDKSATSETSYSGPHGEVIHFVNCDDANINTGTTVHFRDNRTGHVITVVLMLDSDTYVDPNQDDNNK